MAQEVYLKLIVQDGDVDTTTKKLQTLGHEVDNVDKKSKKAGGSLNDSFKGASESANNLQGGVEGIATEFQNVGKAAKAGGAAMRSALISTGIGALIIALGYVVQNWEEIARAVGLSNKSLEDNLDLLNRKQDLLKGELSNLDKQGKLLELQGKSNEEIQKQKLAIIKLQRESTLEELRLLEGQLKRLETSYEELSVWQTLRGVVASALGGAEAVGNVAVDIAEEKKQELQDLRKQINEIKGDLLDLDIQEFRINNPETGDVINRPKNLEVAGDVTEDPEVLRKLAVDDALINIQKQTDQALKDSAEDVLNTRVSYDSKWLQRGAKTAEFFKQLESDKAQAAIASAQLAINAVSIFAKEGSDLAKGVAVAQATIDTYKSAVSAYASAAQTPLIGYILGPIAAGVAVAAGIANVKKILSTKPVENKAPSASGVGGARGVGGVSAPSFNVVGASGQNQIAQTLAERDEQPIQAYVVGSNVTSQQALDRNIQDTATIG